MQGGPRYILVANPGTKRHEHCLRALNDFWSPRGVVPNVAVVPWSEVVPRDGNLDGLQDFDSPAVVRLESQGKDHAVARMLLEAGARDDPSEPPFDWRAMPISRGELVRPGLAARGFRRVLEGLRASFDARLHLSPTACPLAIAAMFDKFETTRLLAASGVPVPATCTFEADAMPVIQKSIRNRSWPNAYIKLNSGASAMGIVVLNPASDSDSLFGISSLKRINGNYFNSRRLQKLTTDNLNDTLEFLEREGAIVQRGIPMAQIDDLNCDVRVVCIHGQPSATIFRLSSHPMTNLHLGGRRGDPARCRAAIPNRVWLDALDHCSEAASAFRSTVAGVDLVFEPGFRRYFILEVNAFGDFFPGWRDRVGRTIASIEIEMTARLQGWITA